MPTTTNPAGLFKIRLAELATTNPEVKSLTIDALVDEITRTHDGDEHSQQLIFNDLLNEVDPYWRVKVSH